MDTIWISNGDRTSRAVVQGRVFLEDPTRKPGHWPGDAILVDSDATSIDGSNTLTDLARAIYGAVDQQAGDQVADIAGLNFKPRAGAAVPEHSIAPRGQDGTAQDGTAQSGAELNGTNQNAAQSRESSERTDAESHRN